MSIGQKSDLGTDPTLNPKLFPESGGLYNYHYYTHYSPLIIQDKDGYLIPWMAESYEVSDDYDALTFHLRKGIKFADGTPFNASVLKFNIDRVITYGWADRRDIIKLTLFVQYDYSEAPDDYTLIIHFKEGWLDLARDFSNFISYFSVCISPADVEPVWDIKGTLKPGKKYNGLGPYYADENESVSEKIVLKKRNSWRDDLNFHKPKLDKIVLIYIVDPQTSVLALEKGEIDYINRYWQAPLDSLPKLETNPDISIKTRPDSVIDFIVTSWWKEPFNGTDGILLRKAICYALDRKDMVEGALLGYGTPATDAMFISPLLPESSECCHKGYEYNLEKAKTLLAEAGWKDVDGDGILDKNGKSLKSVDLLISAPTTTLGWMNSLALIMQSQLKEIGIDVKIRTLEYSAFNKAREAGDFNLLFSYTVPRSYAISQQLKLFNSSLGSFAKAYYCDQNDSLDEIVYDVLMTKSEEKRNQDICQFCNILYEEAGTIPMVVPMQYAVMNKKVKGFEFGPGWGEYEGAEEYWIED